MIKPFNSQISLFFFLNEMRRNLVKKIQTSLYIPNIPLKHLLVGSSVAFSYTPTKSLTEVIKDGLICITNTDCKSKSMCFALITYWSFHHIDISFSIKKPSKIFYCWMIHFLFSLNNVCKIFWFRVLNIASRVKVEYIIYQNKIGFSLLRFKKFFLSFATKIGDFKTTFACPDRNKLLFCFPRQDARIIRNSSKKLKLSLCFFVEFIGIGNFRNTTYYNLSRKIKLFFCGLISKFMQIILAEDFGLPRPFRNQVASLIGHYHCMLQGFKLFFVRVKFYFGCKFHGFKYRIYLFSCQVFNWFFSRKERFLIPMSEARGIRNRG